MRKSINHFLSCFWVSFAFSFILYTPCVEIYFHNAGQFNADPTFLLFAFAVIILASAVVMAALLGLIHAIAPAGAVAVGFACCADVLLHLNIWSKYFADFASDNVLTWHFMLFAIILVGLLALPFILAWHVRTFLAKHATRISIVVILTQTAVVVNSAIHYNAPNYDFKEFTFSEKGKFSFGQKENVIIMVVDCMGEGIFKEVLEKYPELKDSLADFTCFDRMISPLPWTMYAVPAMMTGVDFPRKAYGVPGDDDHAAYLAQVCKGESSLFTALRSKGFRAEGYPFLLPTISYSPEVLDNSIPQFMAHRKETVSKILKLLWKMQCPFFLVSLTSSRNNLPFLTFGGGGGNRHRLMYDQVFYHRLSEESCIGKEKAVFKYLHLQGAHEGVGLNENLERMKGMLKYRQLRGSLRNFELLVSRMKALGIYDNATIVLVGDHTEGYEIFNIAFIKRRGESHDSLVFNSIPCQISDIAGTVLKEYDVVTDLPSLYDKPPMPGDGSVRDEQVRYIDFQPWRRSEQITEDSKYHITCRMVPEADSLIFEDFIDDRKIEIGTQVSLFLSRRDGNGAWMTTLDYSQPYPCLRASLAPLPDGDYRVSLCYYNKDADGVVHRSVSREFPTISILNGKPLPITYSYVMPL